MLPELLDDLKAKVDGALKLAVAGSIAAATGLAAFACFAVALFLWTERSYGLLEAWIVLGSLFLGMFLAGAIALLVIRNRRRPQLRARRRAESRLLQDPAVVVAGLQVARVLASRGMLPLLIAGAIAGGLMLNRNGHSAKGHAPSVRTGSVADSE